MAKTQREMRLRNARPEVDTHIARALARANVVSRNSHGASSTTSYKVAYGRPDLRIVARPRKLAGFRISNKIFLAYAIGFLALFAAVVMRAEMAATQLRLNSLNSQLSSLETQHLRLEVQLSALESPSRIVSYAQSRLGMVYPTQVGYLGAGQNPNSNQNQSTALTQQVISAPNTLFAPPGEAGGGAPTKPLPSNTAATNKSVPSGSSPGSTTAAGKSSSVKPASPSAIVPSTVAKSG